MCFIPSGILVSVVIVSLVMIGNFVDSKSVYLGGSISWAVFGSKVRFTYRLTFEKGSGPCGPGCSSASLSKTGSPVPSLQWTCSSGCSGCTTLNTVNYVVTSIHDKPFDWEHGEGSFSHTFTGTGPYSVSLENLGWSTPASGPGRLLTTVDLRKRNDTSLPNASPIVAVPPYIGIPFGCTSTIELPVMDPDDDSVQCRMSTKPECGDACTTIPRAIVLDQTTCTLTVTATKDKGYSADTDYRVTVTVEDSPQYSIEVGGDVKTWRDVLSSVPIQFTIRVKNTVHGCNTLPTKPVGVVSHKVALPFIMPTVHYKFFMESQIARMSDVAVSVPAGTSISKTRANTTTTEIAADWTPGSEQDGLALLCVWGVQTDGLSTTKKDCFSTIVNDNDDCVSSPCDNGGTCVDLYRRHACKCTLGYSGQACRQRVSCKTKNPCRNGGRCEDGSRLVSCICPPGFTGQRCYTRMLLCTSSPCLHGGTCGEDVPGAFKCLCTPGFTGKLCNTAVNVSSSTARSTNALMSSKLPQPTGSRLHGKQTLHNPSLILPTNAIVQYISGSSHGKDILHKLNDMGLLSIKDKNQQKVNVNVDNKVPEVWPIVVALVGVILLSAAIFGCCWFCGPCRKKVPSKVKNLPNWAEKSKNKDGISQNKEGHRSNTASSNHGPVNQISANDFSNNGVLVAGGSPRILNIYKSSINDPHLHKCGTPTRTRKE